MSDSNSLYPQPLSPQRRFHRVAMMLVTSVALSACAGETSVVLPITDPVAQAALADSAAPAMPQLTPKQVGALAGTATGAGSSMAATQTEVGRKAQQIQGDYSKLSAKIGQQAGTLEQIRGEIRQKSADYFTIVGAINAKLQVGTTPGNPLLVSQWGQAQARLEALSQAVAKLNTLSGDISNTATSAGFLSETIRSTFSVAGAVDEDHVVLRGLQAQTDAAVSQVDRLLSMVSDDISRQSQTLAAERKNLQTLNLAVANGEFYGQNLSLVSAAAFTNDGPAIDDAVLAAQKNTMTLSAPSNTASKSDSALLSGNGKALVVIRFDRANIAYEQALYQAVNKTLDANPNASFELVAVSPLAGNAAEATLAATEAQRNAEGVLRALTQMGLPMDRVKLTASNSADASTSEVHLFVR